MVRKIVDMATHGATSNDKIGTMTTDSFQLIHWKYSNIKFQSYKLGLICIPVSFQNNIRCRKLDLSWNGLGDAGALAIAKALQENRQLRDLDLSSNRISPQGILQLKKVFRKNETLQTLRVSYTV